MKMLKLMADYDSFPLWNASPNEFGNIDPERLPISTQLKADLMGWAETFNNTLDRDDPLNSGFANPGEEQVFKMMGSSLAERLQAELGPGVLVTLKV